MVDDELVLSINDGWDDGVWMNSSFYVILSQKQCAPLFDVSYVGGFLVFVFTYLDYVLYIY